MTHWLLFVAAVVVLIVALVWFVAGAAESAWLGRLLASAILALTAVAMVVQPGRAWTGDEAVR